MNQRKQKLNGTSDWVSLSTNLAGTNALRFTDSANTNGRRRFYRALELR